MLSELAIMEIYYLLETNACANFDDKYDLVDEVVELLEERDQLRQGIRDALNWIYSTQNPGMTTSIRAKLGALIGSEV